MNWTQDNIQNILNTAFKVSYLPIHLFFEKKYLDSCCQSDSYNLPCPFDNIEFLDQKSDNLRNAIWFDPAFKDVFYGILRIQSSYSCLVGPCSTRLLSFMNCQRYAQAHHIDSIQIPESAISRVESLLLLLSSVFQIPIEKPTLLTDPFSIKEMPPVDISDYQMQQYHLNHTERDFLHHSYQVEQNLRRFMLDADEENLLNYLTNMPKETYGTMSYNPDKQEEYIAVIGVSLLARYSIDAGVEQFKAYNLNDLYLQKISKETSANRYQNIYFDAVKHFVTEVKKAKRLASRSVHVERCKQYIYKHLNKQFSLGDVAEYVGLTPAYLSGLFSRFENISIKEYTLQRRIEAAQNMLKYSDYSISQIGYYFCFSSQSHFANIFKKYTGQTPSVFRRINKLV